MDVANNQGVIPVYYEKGETIYLQGGLARNLYIILSGEVQVFRQQDGEENPVATLGAGEYFGEVSLLSGVRHTASVRALSSVNLLIMSGSDFKALATSSKYIKESLDNVLERRLGGSGVAGTEGDGTLIEK